MDIALLEPVLKELGMEKDAPQVAELRKLADACMRRICRILFETRHVRWTLHRRRNLA